MNRTYAEERQHQSYQKSTGVESSGNQEKGQATGNTEKSERQGSGEKSEIVE